MSSIQKNKNEDVREALAVLEEESNVVYTQQRIQDIQHRIEFVCASLRAQGNTELNKMLTSVRELTMEQFCDAYEASTQKFLEQQMQQKHPSGSNHNGLKSIEINDISSSKSKDDHGEAKDSVEKMKADVIKSQNDVDHAWQDIKESQLNTQEQLLNDEPVVMSIKRQNHTNLDIELHTRGKKEYFVVESATKRLNQLNQHQKSHIKSQIEDLQEKLEIFKSSIL
ncbi:hypothetical protein [Parasitella parasitica]|uniref:Uncharacterized protein n=1 Tax=Parasitella parasitica TaxID=35722 RepID=A0A0B7MY57_9FUNG|nr:hypothetical protein [Parasitella parasitica]